MAAGNSSNVAVLLILIMSICDVVHNKSVYTTITTNSTDYSSLYSKNDTDVESLRQRIDPFLAKVTRNNETAILVGPPIDPHELYEIAENATDVKDDVDEVQIPEIPVVHITVGVVVFIAVAMMSWCGVRHHKREKASTDTATLVDDDGNESNREIGGDIGHLVSHAVVAVVCN